MIDGEKCIFSIVRDVTERKRAQEEVERLNTDLAARAFELELANQELEAFNYTVAHDLRKPLTVVNAYCQAIQELYGDDLAGDCKALVQQAVEDVEVHLVQTTHPQREHRGLYFVTTVSGFIWFFVLNNGFGQASNLTFYNVF